MGVTNQTRRPWILGFGAAIFLFGCGGSGGDSHREGSASPVTPPSTAAATVDPVHALDAYVEAVEKIKRRYDRVRTSAQAALKDINENGPDDSWKSVSDRFEQFRDEWGEIAVDAAVIEPPPALSEAHDGLVKSLELNAQFADKIQEDLESRDVSRIIAWATTLDDLSSRSRESRSHWRIQVKAYARKNGVDLPGWVDEVGNAE